MFVRTNYIQLWMARSKLLDVAVREFGSKGLDGASTRGIAAAAGTAMSAITYHYGGKEALYLAAADHVAARMEEDMASVACLPLPTDRDSARRCIHKTLEQFAAKMIAEEDAEWSLFITREQMNPTAAFDRIYEGQMGATAAQLVELIRVATGTSERAARINAILLFGHVLVWRAARALAGRVLLTPAVEDTAAIQAAIALQVDAALDRLSAGPSPIRHHAESHARLGAEG